MTSKLYNYQLEGAKQIRFFKGRVLLADEMGLGKTIQALYWLLKCPSKRPVIVVCPATLKWVWETQANQHIGMRAEILQGRKPPKKQLIKNCPLLIINYEILPYWLEYLTGLNPQVVILDECHYIKSLKAKRTKAVRLFCNTIPHIIAISGTPLTNRPSELFSAINILWPKEFPSFWKYAFAYCKPSRRPWGWDFGGASNLDKLHKKLKNLGMIRRLKKDVLKELPDKTRITVPMDITNKEEYIKAKNSFLTWLKEKSITKAEKAKKAEALVKLGYLKRLSAELKLENVIKWIEDFLEESEGKLVIFGVHTKILNTLLEKFKNIAVIIDGDVPQKERQKAVANFQNNKQKRIFIGNIKAAGTGITLTAASTLSLIHI